MVRSVHFVKILSRKQECKGFDCCSVKHTKNFHSKHIMKELEVFIVHIRHWISYLYFRMIYDSLFLC